jgi:fibronectin type 3 domain-containing protein
VNTTEDTGLAGGTQYCYEVRTVSAAGVVTPFTGTVCGTTSASAAVPPATPTGLAATPGVTGLGDPIVTLNWNPVVGVALYNIYRGDSVGGPLTLQLSATASGVIDAGVVAQTGYCYAITSVSVSGNESAKSAPDCTATF